MTQKFIVDAMLGKLARWLRILGYDTLYYKDAEDWRIVKRAEEDKRIVVTRDRGLCNRARKRGVECFLVVPDTEVERTLAELAVKYALYLDVNPEASRCTECNGILEKRDKNLWRCTRCGKEYWKGRHWDTITEVLIKAQALMESYGTAGNSRVRSGKGKVAGEDSSERHKEETET
jgi:uncharacterized protein with PIN domain